MNILQINAWDLPGRRFNGYDLNVNAAAQGHTVRQLVFRKDSNNPTVTLLDSDQKLRETLIALEQAHDLHGMLMPYGQVLPHTPEFRAADVVHYHLIHNYVLALPDFPSLTAVKPSVWSWHDPWAVTGHCVHPQNCQAWRSGCSPCPHPEEYFPLVNADRAGQLWQVKKDAYAKMDIDIVVSSDFMMDFTRNSPLGQCFPRVHKIPFGIHLETFGCGLQSEARVRLNIPQGNFVIAFRNEPNPYKGVRYIESMLRKWQEPEGITVATTGSARLPTEIKRRFHCVELGWVDDTNKLADFYHACDVFLMPSVAESFGLMAVEAMAAGRPVVCFEGTALPAVTFAPECGIAVKLGDADGLAAAVQHLKNSPEERSRRGELGRKICEEHYKFEDYVRRHLELYEDVIARRRGAL